MDSFFFVVFLVAESDDSLNKSVSLLFSNIFTTDSKRTGITGSFKMNELFLLQHGTVDILREFWAKLLIVVHFASQDVILILLWNVLYGLLPSLHHDF